jgi:uncharacterized membrane protein YedE/YeeE
MSATALPEAFITPLLGGVTLGVAAMWLLLSLGRVAGISGILWGVMAEPDRHWRVFFLMGLLMGGVVVHAVLGMPVPAQSSTPLPLVVFSGLLVGFGTRMGGGCTSGHGVCGIGRQSLRSTVATATFMVTGVLTVFIIRHIVEAAV